MSERRIDPVIDEIREIRQRISAQCNHDTATYIARLKKVEDEYLGRLLRENKASAITTDHSSSVKR